MPFLEQADLPKVVEQAKEVSKDLVEWINKGYKVVTLTASCGLMLKFEWPLLLPNDDKIKNTLKHINTIRNNFAHGDWDEIKNNIEKISVKECFKISSSIFSKIEDQI